MYSPRGVKGVICPLNKTQKYIFYRSSNPQQAHRSIKPTDRKERLFSAVIEWGGMVVWLVDGWAPRGSRVDSPVICTITSGGPYTKNSAPVSEARSDDGGVGRVE